MAAPLYLLFTLLPSVLGKCSVEKATPLFARAVYEFSVDLTQRLGHDTENHFVASPLSLWTILSAVSLGADNITLSEINKTLRRHGVKCFKDRYLDIVREIITATDETTLERSSAVFVDQIISVNENYKINLKRTGVCDIMILSFENFQIAASTINDYVNRATHNNIQEVVFPYDLEQALLILIDAIYFKGAWSYPFEPSKTEPNAPFYDESGNHSGYVNMMREVISLQTIDIDQIQAKVLKLPYGHKGRFSMLIFLPYSNTTVSGVIDLLKHVTIRSIFFNLNQYADDLVDVRIPRFTISSGLSNLKELLVDMGLKTTFNSAYSQFPFISEYDLYVSNVLQKAVINVTEEGTETSPAGAISTKLPQLFTVNKPFLFMIVDKYLNIPLLTGAYSKPSTF